MHSRRQAGSLTPPLPPHYQEESRAAKAQQENESLRSSFDLKSQLDRLETALSERPAKAAAAAEEAATQERMSRVERDVEAIREVLTKQPSEQHHALSEHAQRTIQGAMDSLKSELESIKEHSAQSSSSRSDRVQEQHQHQLAGHTETQERIARIDARLDALHAVLKDTPTPPPSGELSQELVAFMDSVKSDIQALNARQAENEAAAARRELDVAMKRIAAMDGKVDTLKREVVEGLKEQLRDHTTSAAREAQEREDRFNRTREMDTLTHERDKEREEARERDREAQAKDRVSQVSPARSGGGHVLPSLARHLLVGGPHLVSRRLVLTTPRTQSGRCGAAG